MTTTVIKPTRRNLSNDMVVKTLFILSLISIFINNNHYVCRGFSFGDPRVLTNVRSPSRMEKERKFLSGSCFCSFPTSGMRCRIWRNSNLQSKSDDDSKVDVDTTEDDNQGLILPGLPPIGFSSYDPDNQSDDNVIGDGSTKIGFVGTDKFELQYTCKVCDTRNSHKVSRIAYRQGVVIAMCKGCKSRHLIADNLGWSDYDGGFDGQTNIEKYMEANDRGDEVNRVTEEVFELEKILSLENKAAPTTNDEGDHFE